MRVLYLPENFDAPKRVTTRLRHDTIEVPGLSLKGDLVTVYSPPDYPLWVSENMVHGFPEKYLRSYFMVNSPQGWPYAAYAFFDDTLKEGTRYFGHLIGKANPNWDLVSRVYRLLPTNFQTDGFTMWAIYRGRQDRKPTLRDAFLMDDCSMADFDTSANNLNILSSVDLEKFVLKGH